jgi:AcrR family transcriptional regulator
MEPMKKPLRSQPTRDRILVEARRLFGLKGFELTTIRAVATAADINPSMVMRYYGSKEGLFAAAAVFDLGLPDLSRMPRSKIGILLVAHFLGRWDRDGAGDELPALLRVAVGHAGARHRLLEIFRKQVAPAIAKVVPRGISIERAALVATQILGLALTRYVLRLPAVVSLDEATIVERIGATIQSYIDTRD